MTQLITKTDLLSWLSQLLKTHIIVAPTRIGETALFQRITAVEQITLDYSNTAISSKGWFFPPTETLFTVEKGDGPTHLLPARVIEDAVLFGIRPCDAQGIALMDRPFMQAPADIEYQRRRDKTVLVGLSCSRPSSACFCSSVGGGPDNPTYVDLLLTEVEQGYLVRDVTDKGRTLLSSSSASGSQVSPPSVSCTTVISTDTLQEAAPKVFSDPYWDRLADRCLQCNLCAHVCPTCYCFDIRDYTDKGKIERVRTWESCQSRGFTRIAGGYDPRPTKGARLRQRFYHKLFYFPQEFGSLGCTGCGRCVRLCPVNIDIREVIIAIQNLKRGVANG